MTMISRDDVLTGKASLITGRYEQNNVEQHGSLLKTLENMPTAGTEQFGYFMENFADNNPLIEAGRTFMGVNRPINAEIADQRARIQYRATDPEKRDYVPWEDPNFNRLPEEWQERWYDVQTAKESKMIFDMYQKRQKELAERNVGIAPLGVLAGEVTGLGGIRAFGGLRSLRDVVSTTAAYGLDEFILQGTESDRLLEESLLNVGLTGMGNGLFVGGRAVMNGIRARRYSVPLSELNDLERRVLQDTLTEAELQSAPKFAGDPSVSAHKARQQAALDDELPFNPETGEIREPEAQRGVENGGNEPPRDRGDEPMEGELQQPIPSKKSRTSVEDEELVSALWLDKLPDGAVKRILNRGSNMGKTMISELVEHPFYQKKNKDNVATATGVDRKVAINWTVPMVKTMRETEKIYLRYRQRVSGQSARTITGQQMSDALKRNRGEAMSFDEFLRSAGRAKRRIGDDAADFDPEVMEAANLWHQKVYRPMGEAAKKRGLFTRAFRDELADKVDEYNALRRANDNEMRQNLLKDEIMELRKMIKQIDDGDLDPRYLNRIYRKDKIRANREQFGEILIRHGVEEENVGSTIDAILGERPRTPEEDAMGIAGDMLNPSDFTGRAASLRTRTLAFIPDEALEDYLEDNLFAVGKYYTTRMAPDLELMDTFGSISLAPQIKKVREQWKEKIDAARGRDAKEKLEKLRDQEIDDIKSVRDRIRGTYGLPDDPDTWTNRGLRVAKMYNAVTLLTGAIAAIPDMARLVMYDGLMRTHGTLFDAFSQDIRDIMRGEGISNSKIGLANAEAELAGEALDLYLSMRAAIFADLQDAMSATTGFERAAAAATQQFFNFSLMNPWNVGVKTMASLITGSRMLDESVKWASTGRNSAGATITYGEVISNRSNQRIAAKYNKRTNTLELDIDKLREAWQNKAWANPRLRSVDPLPEDQFKTFEEWRDFVIEHELAHADIRPRDGETLAAYENRINQAALRRVGSRGQPSTPYEQTKLARAGIDENMAWRIAIQFEEHGVRNGRVRIAKTENWTDKEAAKAYRAALGKEINTIIVTPGAGDLPNFMGGGFERNFRERAESLKAKRDAGEASMAEKAELLFMSPQMAQILFQFKSFGASATQRILVPGLQHGDRNFIVGAAAAVGMGMMVSMFRNEQNEGRSQKLPELIKDGIDRSGILGYFSDLNGLVETFTDNRFGLGPLLGENPRKSSGTYRAGAVLGPSVNQVSNLSRVVSGLSDGHVNSRDAGYIRKTFPTSRVFWADGIWDSAEDAIVGTK